MLTFAVQEFAWKQEDGYTGICVDLSVIDVHVSCDVAFFERIGTQSNKKHCVGVRGTERTQAFSLNMEALTQLHETELSCGSVPLERVKFSA